MESLPRHGGTGHAAMGSFSGWVQTSGQTGWNDPELDFLIEAAWIYGAPLCDIVKSSVSPCGCQSEKGAEKG